MFTGSRPHQFDHQQLVLRTDRRAGQRRPVPPSLTADAFGNHQVIFGEDQDGPWAECDQCDWRERYPSERERDWYARWHSTEMCIREQQRLSERVIPRLR